MLTLDALKTGRKVADGSLSRCSRYRPGTPTLPCPQDRACLGRCELHYRCQPARNYINDGVRHPQLHGSDQNNPTAKACRRYIGHSNSSRTLEDLGPMWSWLHPHRLWTGRSPRDFHLFASWDSLRRMAVGRRDREVSLLSAVDMKLATSMDIHPCHLTICLLLAGISLRCMVVGADQ